MTRQHLVARLSDEVFVRRSATRPFLVGIDGRCAAGKTRLADELAAELAARDACVRILRPSVDGFHHSRERRYRQGEFSARGYYEDAFDYSLLIDTLLAPLSGERFPVNCRHVTDNWRAEQPLDAPAVSVPANTILLFDGVFLFRREIDGYWNLRILVDVDAETSIARAVERDGEALGGREIAEKKYRLRYEPAWQIYLEAERPATKADFLIDNRDLSQPGLLGSNSGNPSRGGFV